MTEIVWGLSGVDATKAPGMRKPKTISYTGCWTCRERHIKCDERPVSCRNCETSKRVCAGYGVRLRWPSNEQDPFARQAGRRRRSGIAQTQERVPVSSYRQFTTARTLGSPRSLLSTLQLHLSSPPDQPSHDRCSEVPERDPSPEVCLGITREDAGLNPASDLSPCSNANSSAPSEEFRSLALIASMNGQTGVINSNVPTTSSDFLLNAPLGASNQCKAVVVDETCKQLNQRSDEPMSSRLPVLSSSTTPQVNHELPLITFGDSATALLLHHYTNHMINLMQPVSHQSNPFRNIYLQLAITGSQSLWSSRLSGQDTLARISVFHSVLASAAVNLQSLTFNQASYFYQLGCYHRREALKAARDALTDKASSYKELMTAILSLVSVDIVDGGTHDHWIHLEAATQLRNSRQKSRLVGLQTRQLNAMCRMLGLFAQTALYDPHGKPWTGSITTGEDSRFEDLGPSIEFIYGITPYLAKAIFNNHELASCLAYYDEDYPESLIEGCESFHDELVSWDINSEMFSTISIEDGPALGVARAQVTAFYNAILIYHYRSVQRCEREELHSEQREVLKAMNLAEDLKAKFQRQDEWAAPITWPAFVASCEAVGDFRRQWASWWDQVQTYGLANYAKQRSLIHQVWSKQDDVDGRKDWREILFDMNVRIIPV